MVDGDKAHAYGVMVDGGLAFPFFFFLHPIYYLRACFLSPS